MGSAYRCACRFSSCLLVNAGLLSGFGPLFFGGWPSTVGHQIMWHSEYTEMGGLPRVAFFSVNVFKNPRLMESGLFPLSDWPLPTLPPGLLSIGGDSVAIAAGVVGEKGCRLTMGFVRLRVWIVD